MTGANAAPTGIYAQNKKIPSIFIFQPLIKIFNAMANFRIVSLVIYYF
jgi:hypothetical protein